MNATTVAVDLAKSVFQLAVADHAWRVVETHRLTRTQFERWFQNRDVGLVIMEACGSAHHWARWLNSLGIAVKLLPAAYVRAYVRRNKTDRADACALLEAARASDLQPVRIKSVEQQALQGLHRIRSLWMGTRTSRINALRGFCREFGLSIPQGSRTGVEAIARLLAAHPNLMTDLSMGGGLKRYEKMMTANPQAFRDFIVRHQDRILWGADVILKAITAEAFIRHRISKDLDILEQPRYVDPDLAPGKIQTGLALPRAVLEKIFWDNPRRVIASAPPPPGG
jgi:Transposase/Amidohydrolase